MSQTTNISSQATAANTVHAATATGIPVTLLTETQITGHADHWRILTQDLAHQVQAWLKEAIDTATLPTGLSAHPHDNSDGVVLLGATTPCHIKQILQMQDSRPARLINTFPCVHSPYGLYCRIERAIVDANSQDAILKLITDDGTVIYAFDQLYAVNEPIYTERTRYFVNFSAWAYQIAPSRQDEVIQIEDPDAIRHHRAFNDILAQNDGVAPADLHEQIRQWQPTEDTPLAPVEINLGHMCAYLFGEVIGQEDEAWCQGQVLGKQTQTFFDVPVMLLDVAILREPNADPFVVRMASPITNVHKDIEVGDYIQANIWLQAAIYK